MEAEGAPHSESAWGERLPDATFPRVATLTVLAAGEVRFGVANVHLDEHREENRLSSARQLVEWLDLAQPWVVAGDLNTTPGTEVRPQDQ